MTQKTTSAADPIHAPPRQLNRRFTRRLAGWLGCGIALSFLMSGAASTPTQADSASGSVDVASSPLVSEIAAWNAQRLNLNPCLSPSGGFSSPARTTLNFGLDLRRSPSILSDAPGGFQLFQYNPLGTQIKSAARLSPSLLASAAAADPHLATPVPIVASAAPPAPTPESTPASAPAGTHHETFTLGGQMFLSEGNAASTPATPAGGYLDMTSGAGAAPTAPGFLGETASQEAYNQNLAYSGTNMNLTASIAKIGRNFADDGLYTPTLAGTDQTNDSTANGLMSRRGQDEQTMALSLGAAKQTGQFSFNLDDLTDLVNHKRTALQSLGYTWGDLTKTQFSFNTSSSSDLIGHTHNNTQTLALNQALGKLATFQASHIVQNQGAAGSATSTTDKLNMVLAPDKRLALGANIAENMTRTTFGGDDQTTIVNLHRTLGGLTLGAVYGDEQRKSVASEGAAASLASIHTIGYNASKQISKVFSVDTNWQKVGDTSQCRGRRRLATETTHFNYNPFKPVTLLDQYTTSNGINNRLLSASYAVTPKALTHFGFGPVTFSATRTETSGINAEMNQASTQTEKLALDTTLIRRSGRGSSLVPSFLSDTTVHFETGIARIDDFKNSSGELSQGEDADVQGVKLGGSFTRWKAAHWSYGYAVQTPTTAGAAKLPDAHEIDFSAPISKLTMTVYDHDQVDQGNGNYKHATDKHLSLAGALDKTLNLTFDTGESRDYTLANPSHTRMMGVHLSGKHGSLQNLDFKLQRQLESEYHNGRNNQTIYGLNFNLPKTDTRHLSLNCAVTDNKYVDRPSATGKMTATVGFDFAQQF